MTSLQKSRAKNGEGHLRRGVFFGPRLTGGASPLSGRITLTPTPPGDLYLPINQGGEHSSNTHHTYRKSISYMKKSNEGIRKAMWDAFSKKVGLQQAKAVGK